MIGFKKLFAAALTVATSCGIAVTAGAAPYTTSEVIAYAEGAITSYDKTRIEDDLNGIEIGKYPKDKNAGHRLLDQVGFMEYGYSHNEFITGNYFGIYFYVYNPAERAISTREGANAVNLATEYNADGEPVEYSNCSLTFLSKTSNDRFYKFRLTDSAAVLEREKKYAAMHGGERRYDVAGIQVWFTGDKNATDSRTGADGGEKEGVSFTYFCTGYAAGCGASADSSSTLQVREQKLDTIKLNVRETYYRTGAGTGVGGTYNSQTTLSSVYFSVPNRYIDEYGALQIVKAQWYEYKTSPIFVCADEKAAKAIKPYLGYTLQNNNGSGRIDKSVPFEIYQYTGPSDSGMQGISYNRVKSNEHIPRMDWLIKTETLTQEVSPVIVKDYAYNYTGNREDELLEIKEKQLNANLFRKEADEGRTPGFNEHVFDARNEEDWIDLKLENTTDVWNRFLNAFRIRSKRYETFLERDVKPIEKIEEKNLVGSENEISERILVSPGDVQAFEEYYDEETEKGNAVYLFRFAATEYYAVSAEFHDEDDGIFGTNYKDMYIVKEATAFLDFEIIYLGFVKNEKASIIPVVSSPIDIFPALTPPPNLTENYFWETFYWILGLAGASLVGAIVSAILNQRKRLI